MDIAQDILIYQIKMMIKTNYYFFNIIIFLLNKSVLNIKNKIECINIFKNILNNAKVNKKWEVDKKQKE